MVQCFCCSAHQSEPGCRGGHTYLAALLAALKGVPVNLSLVFKCVGRQHLFISQLSPMVSLRSLHVHVTSSNRGVEQLQYTSLSFLIQSNISQMLLPCTPSILLDVPLLHHLHALHFQGALSSVGQHD
ncbi:hypothetical protein WJX73_004947 [Symbiochloris irregularis]|uniref:Uncharacterized protein n=1 Tax=Symbiochloris irregularis TaxID=706552 RepID=A0AAW1NT10_9CHLO